MSERELDGKETFPKIWKIWKIQKIF